MELDNKKISLSRHEYLSTNILKKELDLFLLKIYIKDDAIKQPAKYNSLYSNSYPHIHLKIGSQTFNEHGERKIGKVQKRIRFIPFKNIYKR